MNNQNSHSLAKTIGRITEENPKRVKAPSGTIDLSRKTTKDIPSMYPGVNAGTNVNATTGVASSTSTGSYGSDLAAKIAALESSEKSKLKLVCASCGATSSEGRLTCATCGKYFSTGAEKTIWENPIGFLQNQSTNVHDQEKIALRNYLFKRAAAKAVDLFIVGSMISLEFISYLAIAKSLLAIPSAAALMLNFFYVGVPAMAVLTILGYQAAFESSPVQATLGKFWLGLYVTNNDGENVGAEKVVFKTILSLSPIVAFLAVYSFFYETTLRLGAHLDAPTASVLAMTALACFVTFGAMHILIGTKKRQTVPDLLTGCVVRERA